MFQKLLFISCLALWIPTSVVLSQTNASVFPAAIAGVWDGSLEYIDYQNGQTVQLPVQAQLWRSGMGVRLILNPVFTEPNGKKLEWLNVLLYDPKTQTIDFDHKEVYRVETFSATDSTLKMILYKDGEDNDKKALIRYTLTWERNTLNTSEEYQYPNTAFKLRNRFILKRRNQ